jgi:hypothetical protein
MIILQRELFRIHPDDRLSRVVASFGQPVRVVNVEDDDDHWTCSFQILGLDQTITEQTQGTDSLEALLNALIKAGEHLYRFSESVEPLMWDGLPGLGFPKFDELELQKNLAFAKRPV